jgi:hypothetical protein
MHMHMHIRRSIIRSIYYAIVCEEKDETHRRDPRCTVFIGNLIRNVELAPGHFDNDTIVIKPIADWALNTQYSRLGSQYL